MKITRRKLRKIINEATGYGDINDPYNPDANTSAVMFDMPDELERDTLEPGEQFEILEFELDLQEFADDPTALSSILDKARAMGGITVHFRSSKDKLLGLASHIHGTGGGPSFSAEEFAEDELTPVTPGK